MLLVAAAGFADRGGLEAVRAKGVLSTADAHAIDEFVARSVNSILSARSFHSIAAPREVFLANITSNSAVGGYDEMFAEAAEREFRRALAEASIIGDSFRRDKVRVNLLIMMEPLARPEVARLAFPLLQDDCVSVRYWAAKVVCSPAVIDKLNALPYGREALAEEIISALEKAVSSENELRILVMMAEFAASLDNARTADLLAAVAQQRLRQYSLQPTAGGLGDRQLMRILSRRVARGDRRAARYFADMLAAAMQGYIAHLSAVETPVARGAAELATVLIDVERDCLGELLPGQTAIRDAVAPGRSGLPALQAEYERLFGDSATEGRLTEALNLESAEGAQNLPGFSADAVKNMTTNDTAMEPIYG